MPQVWMLSATQALCMSGSFLFVLLGGTIGSELAPAPGLATLPVSALVLGLAASVVPAGALIRRQGRRAIFVASALAGGLGCVIAGLAIMVASFWLFCGAALLLGANNATVMQYRLAAVEHVPRARQQGHRDRHEWRAGRGLARPGSRGACRRTGRRSARRGLVLRRHRALRLRRSAARAQRGLHA